MADGKTPAVFFDRDGTIMQDVNYCSDHKAEHEHVVNLRLSISVEYKEIDVHCGHNAVIKVIRVRTGFETNTADSSADWIAQDFAEATEIILTKFAPA